MRYSPVKDISGLDKSSTNLKKVQPWIFEIVHATRFTLKHPRNLKRACRHDRELLGTLDDYLALFELTHNSLRLLIKQANRTREWATISDGTSLCREQVEKLFCVALVLSDPDKWVIQSLRSGFKTEYEEHLLFADEQAGNPRFAKYLAEQAPKFIEQMRLLDGSGRRRFVFVSKLAMRALKHDWDNPGVKPGKWFTAKGGIRNYIREYFDFPTPGKAIQSISDPELKAFLRRWHREYVFMCQYSHAASGKMILPELSAVKHIRRQEHAEIYATHLANRTVITSLMSMATSCALILDAVENTHGAMDDLHSFWKKLVTMGLPAKAMWNMYLHKLFHDQSIA